MMGQAVSEFELSKMHGWALHLLEYDELYVVVGFHRIPPFLGLLIISIKQIQ